MSTPTGTIELRDGKHVLVQTREFRAPIEDVWAAVTESDRLARWIGSWEGDPESGSVQFRMLFEGRPRGRDHDDPGLRAAAPPARDLPGRRRGLAARSSTSATPTASPR